MRDRTSWIRFRLAGVQARFVSALAPDSDAPNVVGPLWERLHEHLGEVEPVEKEFAIGFRHRDSFELQEWRHLQVAWSQ